MQSVFRLTSGCFLPAFGGKKQPYYVFKCASLNALEPPECFAGDLYAARNLPHVPARLDEAADRFAASDFAARAFGAEVVEHYTHFFRTEQAAFASAVTDWERRRYFEQI